MTRLLLGAAMLALLAGCATVKQPELDVAVQSSGQIWNAVAHYSGRTFLSGPRWTGTQGPQLTAIDQNGQRAAYPSGAWNSWAPGRDAANVFVNINALRLEGDKLWVVDTGSPEFGGNPVSQGAKLVCIDLRTNQVVRTYFFGPDIAMAGSYVDDVRFSAGKAFLTDAGNAGIIVVDLETGAARRVLDQHTSVVARPDRDLILSNQVVKAPDGQPLRVNADPLEVSIDGVWLYYGALQGPWFKVRIQDLTNPALPPEQLAARVEFFADIPATGGSVMDAQGNLYFSDLAHDAMRVRRPDGQIDTLIVDERLHWVDAPFLDKDGTLWLPTPQMDRVALFNKGKSLVQWPVAVYRLSTQR
ncbi:L-dopachrome tautomerase-related protein [Pseudomonas sp. WMBT8]|uniref:L-dopachrome tautomerase-related protein n=1 Tax=Pseudomonas sp. WMBT8 TaxID=3414496 RepID=UPI003D80122E